MAGLCDRLDRIEAKLDALVEALAEDEEPDVVEVTTMDGHRMTVPTADGIGHL